MNFGILTTFNLCFTHVYADINILNCVKQLHLCKEKCFDFG